MSKKQNVVARTYVESQFRAIAQGLCELLWFKIIFYDLQIKRKYSIKLYNNKSDINIAHNPIQHNKTKHIKVARHFIKEKLEKRIVYMSYVPHSFNL